MLTLENAIRAACAKHVGKLGYCSYPICSTPKMPCKPAVIILAAHEAMDDYYPSHEALVDLVQLWAEYEALTGGGPGWQGRFDKALAIAHELTRREP